jgi:DNA invertase Pin-like site-specific DNA recombinase
MSVPAQRTAIQRRATELDAEFQEMMARLKAERGTDYVIVYARSRLHRNSVGAAITKRDLRKAAATIISIMDCTEDSAIGDLVTTVIDGVNEYQSRASGADVAYKLARRWHAAARWDDRAARRTP